MAKLTITIDTNCINAKPSLEAMTRLEHLHSEGHIEIIKTDVLDTELLAYKGPKGERARKKSAGLAEDAGIVVWDHSRWGHARWAGDEDVIFHEGLAQKIFGLPWKGLNKNQIRDVMMVATHIRNGRDYLVTLDKC